MITVLSLGAGVQSTTLLLRSLRGDAGFPKLDAAIFADTGYETAEVYNHIDRLRPLCETAGVPLHVVRSDDPERFGKWEDQIFAYTDSGGPQRRFCTNNLKVKPIRARLRKLVDNQKTPGIVRLVFGISWDETQRMRDSDVLWIQNVYPLIDQRIRRVDCLRWLAEHWPHPVPRSACWNCPYRTNAEWRHLKNTEPRAWGLAVKFDRGLRGRANGPDLYLHRSAAPLDEVDLSTPEDHGQASLFGSECEGLCGV